MAKMNPDKFLTPVEMRDIADICEHLDVTAKMIEDSNVSVDLFVDYAGYGLTHLVTDTNGEALGKIGRGDAGFVLYLDTREPKIEL
jgi:hypothetical protein